MSSQPSPQAAVRPSAVAAGVRFVSVDKLRTSYALLRPAQLPPQTELSAELPLRVARRAQEDEVYEVVDGFKRLSHWRARGAVQVPVVVEPASAVPEHKRLLLAANAPARTTTALDEARVVCSLMQEDGCTAGQVARLLGHKPEWVARRIALGTKLAPAGEAHLACGAIGPALAHALTELAEDDQDALLQSIDKHGLRAGEALMLVGAYRAADETDRKQLLRTPLEQLRAQRQASPTLSPRAVYLEAELGRIQEALADFGAFQIPAELAPAEQRRLRALYYGVVEQLRQLAQRLCTLDSTTTEDTGEHHGSQTGRDGSEPDNRFERAAAAGQQGQAGSQAGPDPARDTRRDPAAERVLQRAADRNTGEPAARVGHQSAAGTRRLVGADPAEGGQATEQARALPRARRGACPQAAHHDSHPARDPEARIPRAQIDPGCVRARASVQDGSGAAKESQAPL